MSASYLWPRTKSFRENLHGVSPNSGCPQTPDPPDFTSHQPFSTKKGKILAFMSMLAFSCEQDPRSHETMHTPYVRSVQEDGL